MKKILVTGYKGYIGSNLWDYLKNEYTLFGIDKPTDIITCSKSALVDVDYVIHLASLAGVRKSHVNPHLYLENNILSSKRIFDRYKNIPILFSSSSSVIDLKSPYAMSKYAIELMAPSNCIKMRFFTVYGGKNYRKDMLYGMAKDDTLKEISYNMKRDFTHIDDVCRAIKILLHKGRLGETYDIGHGNPKDVPTFLKEIGYTKELPERENSFGESFITMADPTKMRDLGW